MELTDFEASIMGQFTIESMLNNRCSFDLIEFGLTLDDDFSVAHFQSMAGVYALYSKQFILSDKAEPDSPAGIVTNAIKAHINAGINSGSFANNQCMKHLLSLSEMDTLASHIATLTAHSILKDVEDINDVPHELMTKYLTPDSVALPMGFYVATVCIGNSNFQAESFNEIFAHAWHNYYQTAMVKLVMFKMAGNQWKSQFLGSLFD